jgi:hypothetical protein
MPIWMNSRIAARAGGMSIRLERRIKIVTIDQARALEMRRGRVAGRRRGMMDPAISGVGGYFSVTAIDRIRV